MGGTERFQENGIIQIENLVKRYGSFVALDHLNLNVREGEIFGLLGPNGSGKTTVINCMLALLKYDKGSIRIFGQEMAPDHYEVKKQIGIILQNVAVFDELTVYENIDYFCGLYVKEKEKRKSLVKEAIAFVGLEDYEPTVAVDPQSRNRILEGIQELNRQGATIVYTSHYMEEVEQICSRIAIMDHGRSIAVGTKEQLTGMIKTGEKVTIEAVVLSEEQLAGIRELPHVFAVDYQNDILTVQCTKARHNLVRILHCLEEQGTAFGRVYSELPTLNDVFLEITGKQLRD